MPKLSPQNPIAYFSAEYGIESQLPFYAGGLGVLSGDTIKAMGDLNVPFTGVGLLYRGERMIQEIDSTGMQVERDMEFDPVSAGLEHVYLDDRPLFIKVHLTELDVWVRVWKKTFSENVVLYLLDTDTDQNQLQERSITHGLYIGTEGTSIKQQFILGIGGIKVLTALGIHPAVYHINEGRPAFLFWQLIRTYMMVHGMNYQEAYELAQTKVVYTNHTLVAAGNNTIQVDFLKRYAQYYAEKMGITIDQLLEKGIKKDPKVFSMTTFGLNISRKASGVSSFHTELSKKIWPEYSWVNITNGVHLPTWQNEEVRNCSLENDDLWHVHQKKKQELSDYVKQRTSFGFDPNRLVITWARRLAGYKRLPNLFDDIELLRKILRDSNRPVQLLVAGKAHISDKQGKLMLQGVIKHMAKELSDYSLFIPNYDLELAQKLVAGSDLWLNIPEIGKEACGTSGMKAVSNGVIQCTVPDGWAAEVDWSGAGWTLESENISENVYKKLQEEIIPTFYDRDANGVPQNWLNMMKKSVELCGRFSAKRMMTEYREKLYEL